MSEQMAVRRISASASLSCLQSHSARASLSGRDSALSSRSCWPGVRPRVVHPVGLQQIVGVNQADHILKIAMLGLVVPVLDQRHTAKIMRLHAHRRFKARLRQRGLSICQHVAVGVHLHAVARQLPVRQAHLHVAHAQQRPVFHAVVVDHEGAARVQTGGAGTGALIGIEQLHALAADTGGARQLRVHAVDGAAAIGAQQRRKRLLLPGRLVAHRIADQITRRHRGDIARVGMRQP